MSQKYTFFQIDWGSTFIFGLGSSHKKIKAQEIFEMLSSGVSFNNNTNKWKGGKEN